jgi:glycosyltransferase involved in cell wall biosynthesis
MSLASNPHPQCGASLPPQHPDSLPPIRILLIAYGFPPVGGIMVMRALSLAKYLPDSGFQVHVLSAANAAAPVHDPSLLAHVPPSVNVHRAFTPELPFHFRKRLWRLVTGHKPSSQESSPQQPPSESFLANLARRIFSPDPQVVWVPFAIRAARRIIRRHHIQAVLVTAPPFSTFLIGNALKAAFPHIKLISDFRDEWLRFYLTDFDFLRSNFTRRRAEQIESQTIAASDLVVAVTESSLREIRSRYPNQPDSKFALIHNGYDPDALRPILEHQPAHPTSPKEKVIITHLGTAYRTASPSYFLDAIQSLPESIRSRLEIRFIGRVSETEERLLAAAGPGIRVLGFLPQQQALAHLAETDYLLLTMTNEFSLPGKLFEYLASGKPIIALSPANGEVARLIAETGAGWCVPHDQPESIRRVVSDAVHFALENRIPFHTRREVVSRFERPRLIAAYAALIRQRLFADKLN